MDYGAECYRRYLGGDDNGIVEIIRDYKDGLILFLSRYTGSVLAAEELAEETFFRLVTRRPLFAPKASFKTWLYTVGRNTAISHIRRAEKVSGKSIDELGGLPGGEAELEEALIRVEERRVVHRALGRLRPDYALVLHLKFFEDMTNEEAARAMKRSRRQIENLAYQAKLALRAELDREGFIYEGL